MDTTSVPGGDVLLTEKYNVVATAIVSALKRFAPSYKFHIASSLHGAELLATKTAPELFVIDFDPPEEGAIGFFTRMRSAHSSARVLVITPGVSPEVVTETAEMGAIHFLAKPFELTDFGDAVEALLNLRRARPRKTPKELRALHLVDLLHLLCSAGSSAVVLSENDRGHSGEVHIYDGQICHAVCGSLTGLDALQMMFTWHEARFGEGRKGAFYPRTIEGAWSEIIVHALREAKLAEAEGVMEPTPVPAAERVTELPPVPEVKTTEIPVGKKIVIIEDAEELRVFLETILGEADRTPQITTARYGMEGLQQVQQIDPDMILLDYSLPDINGDEICRSLLANPTTARIPVVLMSSLVAEITAAALRFENVVATIAKPFLSEQITALVEKTLAGGRIAAARTAVASASVSPPVTLEPTFSQPPPMEEVPVGNGKHPVASASSDGSASAQEAGSLNPTESATVAPQQPSPAESPAATQTSIARGSTPARNDVMIGIPLQVIAMQLGAFLQINAVRARPLSAAVSFHILSSELRGVIPLEVGFKLDSVTLDGNGRITGARLVPTLSPSDQIPTRGAFEIAQVSVAANANDRIQLISAATAPMTVQLLTHFEFSTVEISKKFVVAALVLRACHDFAAVTLDQAGQIGGKSTIPCALSAIQLDSSSRIAELSLIPRLPRLEAAPTSR